MTLEERANKLVKQWTLIDVSPREFLPSETALYYKILEAFRQIEADTEKRVREESNDEKDAGRDWRQDVSAEDTDTADRTLKVMNTYPGTFEKVQYLASAIRAGKNIETRDLQNIILKLGKKLKEPQVEQCVIWPTRNDFYKML